MGASFRNIGEIEALAGCDRLTISPALLEQLQQKQAPLLRTLNPDTRQSEDKRRSLDEKTFRWEMNQDAMATEKLAEGIRSFTIDQEKLEVLIRQKLG
jgi:transaldolase